MDKQINAHRVALGLGDQGLQDLIDKMHNLFTKCLQASSKDSTLVSEN